MAAVNQRNNFKVNWYNPSLERLRNQTDKIIQKNIQKRRQQTTMMSFLDPFFNIKAQKKLGAKNWFEGVFKGFFGKGGYFDNNYAEWFRSPGQALVNNLRDLGGTLDYASNLIKAPLIAAAKGEDVGTRLADAYGLGNKGRVEQNMSEFREALNCPASGTVSGLLAGTMIGTQIAPGLGTLIGAAVGTAVGGTADILRANNIRFGDTITDIALEYSADPGNIAGTVAAPIKAIKVAKLTEELGEETVEVATKAAKEATEEAIKQAASTGLSEKETAKLAQQLAHENVKKAFDTSREHIIQYAKGIKKNISAEEAYDYITQRIAEQAVANTMNLKDAGIAAAKRTSFFNGYKKRMIDTIYDNDINSFKQLFVQSNMQQMGDAYLFDDKITEIFNILVKDANASKAYKFFHWIDSFDQQVAKNLMTSLPLGMSAKIVKAGISKSADLVKHTVLQGKYRKINLDDETFNMFDEELTKFKEEFKTNYGFEHISKKQLLRLDSSERINYYKQALQKSKEIEEQLTKSVDKVEQEALSLKLNKLYNIMHNIPLVDDVNYISLRYKMMHLISRYFNKYGKDLDKLIEDKSFKSFFNDASKLLKITDDNIGYDLMNDLLFSLQYIKQGKYKFNDYISVIIDALHKQSNEYIINQAPNEYLKYLQQLTNKIRNAKDNVFASEELVKEYTNNILKTMEKVGTYKTTDDTYKVPDIVQIRLAQREFDSDDVNNYIKQLGRGRSKDKQLHDYFYNLKEQKEQLIKSYEEYQIAQQDRFLKLERYNDITEAERLDISDMLYEDANKILDAYAQNKIDNLKSYRMLMDDFNKILDHKETEVSSHVYGKYKRQVLEKYKLTLTPKQYLYLEAAENVADNIRAKINRIIEETEKVINDPSKTEEEIELIVKNTPVKLLLTETETNLFKEYFTKQMEVTKELSEAIRTSYVRQPQPIMAKIYRTYQWMESLRESLIGGGDYGISKYIRSNLEALQRQNNYIIKNNINIDRYLNIVHNFKNIITQYKGAKTTVGTALSEFIKNDTEFAIGLIKQNADYNEFKTIIQFLEQTSNKEFTIDRFSNFSNLLQNLESGKITLSKRQMLDILDNMSTRLKQVKNNKIQESVIIQSSLTKVLNQATELNDKFLKENGITPDITNLHINPYTYQIKQLKELRDMFNNINKDIENLHLRLRNKATFESYADDFIKDTDLDDYTANELLSKIYEDIDKYVDALDNFKYDYELFDTYAYYNLITNEQLSLDFIKSNSNIIQKFINEVSGITQQSNRDFPKVYQASILNTFAHSIENNIIDNFKSLESIITTLFNVYNRSLEPSHEAIINFIKRFSQVQTDLLMTKELMNVLDFGTEANEYLLQLVESYSSACQRIVHKFYDNVRAKKIDTSLLQDVQNIYDSKKGIVTLNSHNKLFGTINDFYKKGIDAFKNNKDITIVFKEKAQPEVIKSAVKSKKVYDTKHYVSNPDDLYNDLNTLTNNKFLEQGILDSVVRNDDVVKVASLNPDGTINTKTKVPKGILSKQTTSKNTITSDIETKIMNKSRQAEFNTNDLIQVAFSQGNTKYNLYVYSPDYKRGYKNKLLDPNIVNGKNLSKEQLNVLMAKPDADMNSFVVLNDGSLFFKDSQSMFKYFADYISKNVDISDKYLRIVGYNNSAFDNPFILKGLKEAGLNLDGIVGLDNYKMLQKIKAYGLFNRYLNKKPENDLDTLANILADSRSLKQTDVFDLLVKEGLIQDTSNGLAHNAFTDIDYTNSLYSRILSDITTDVDDMERMWEKSKKSLEEEYANYSKEIRDYVIKRYRQEFLELYERVDMSNISYYSYLQQLNNKISNITNSRLYNDRFALPITELKLKNQNLEDGYIKDLIDNINDTIKELSAVNTDKLSYLYIQKVQNIIDDLERLPQDLDKSTKQYAYDMFDINIPETIINLQQHIDDLEKARHYVMQGIYGDSTVYISDNLNYMNHMMLYQYENIAYNGFDDDTFRLIKDIFTKKIKDYKGDNKVAMFFNDYYNVVNNIQDNNLHKELDIEVYNRLKRFYKHTDRIEAYSKFYSKILEIFNNKVKVDGSNLQEISKAYTTILDALFSSNKHINSLNSIISGFHLYNRHKYKTINEFKAELEKIIEDKFIGSKTHKNLLESIAKLTNDADSDKFYKQVISPYVNDCINNIDDIILDPVKYNYRQILNPQLNRTSINTYNRAIRNMFDRYDALMQRSTYLPKAELYATFDSAKKDFGENILYMRHMLSYAKNSTLRNIEMPEAYISEMTGMSLFDINSQLYKQSIRRSPRSEDMLEASNLINSYRDLIGVSFDIFKESPVVSYRNMNSIGELTMYDILKKSGLSSFEIESIFNNLTLNNTAIDNTSKIRALSMYYDELENILDQLPENARNMFNTYKQMVDVVFENNISYTKVGSEDMIGDAAAEAEVEMLRAQAKAIAVTLYLSDNNDIDIYSALNSVKVFDDNIFNPAIETSSKHLVDYTANVLSKNNNDILEAFRFGPEPNDIDWVGMYNYIQNNKDLNFVFLHHSDKYQIGGAKQFLKGKSQSAGELNIINVDSAQELEQLYHLNRDDLVFSILDKNTINHYKKVIGHIGKNKVYKSNALNKLIVMRNAIMHYVCLPVKMLGLQNIGFTVTNAIEGAIKTLTSTTGSRLDTIRQYTRARQYHKQWYDTLSEIDSLLAVSAKDTAGNLVTIGSPLYKRIKDYTKLLEYDKVFGDAVKEFGDNFIQSGAYHSLPNYVRAIYEKSYSNHLTDKYDYTMEEYVKAIIQRSENIKNMLANTNSNIYKLLNNTEFYDIFNMTNRFMNSSAAAAEFQSLMRSDDLGIIGASTNAKAIDNLYNKLFFTKWFSNNGHNNVLTLLSPAFNLGLNSDIETINRLAMYLDLGEKGFTDNEVLNKVLRTHFNYGNKSQLELTADMIFPFISFPLRTFMYWADALEENPALIKFYTDLALQNWKEEADNRYNQGKISKGGLWIFGDVAMETGLSVFSSMSFTGNPIDSLFQKKLNPIIGYAYEGAKSLIIGEKSDKYDYRFSRLPVVSHIKAGVNLANSLSKNEIHPYTIAPSIFNRVYQNNGYYYRNQGRYVYKNIYNNIFYAHGKQRSINNQIKRSWK